MLRCVLSLRTHVPVLWCAALAVLCKSGHACAVLCLHLPMQCRAAREDVHAYNVLDCACASVQCYVQLGTNHERGCASEIHSKHVYSCEPQHVRTSVLC